MFNVATDAITAKPFPTEIFISMTVANVLRDNIGQKNEATF